LRSHQKKKRIHKKEDREEARIGQKTSRSLGGKKKDLSGFQGGHYPEWRGIGKKKYGRGERREKEEGSSGDGGGKNFKGLVRCMRSNRLLEGPEEEPCSQEGGGKIFTLREPEYQPSGGKQTMSSKKLPFGVFAKREGEK